MVNDMKNLTRISGDRNKASVVGEFDNHDSN